MNMINNKFYTRIAALLLALLTMLTFASCGGGEGVTADVTTTAVDTAAETQVQEEDNGRLNAKDNLPDDLDFNGAEVRVLSRTGDPDTLIEFVSETATGEVVNDAVYDRNLAVQERLNVALTVIRNDSATRHKTLNDIIRKSVTAGSDDYDVLANAIYGAAPLTLEGMHLNLAGLPYIDTEQPWWSTPFIDITEYNGKHYMLTGELSQTMTSGTYAMFFNKNLFAEYFKDEPSIYETVSDGEWTLDRLISYCTPVYEDLNGDGRANEGDRFGHFFTDKETLECDAFTGGADIRLIEKLPDGSYIYNGTAERTVTFIEKMNKLLFEDNNTCRTPNNDETIMATMLRRETIFTTWLLTGVNYLRDMDDDYGIIPIPKLDEGQENYTTFNHDGSTSFALPATVTNAELSCAFLEASAAETYRTVTPAYFETALKTKYSRDEESSRMLDMIVASSYQDFMYVFGQNLGAPISMLRTIFANSTNCGKALSTLAAKESSITTMIDTIITKLDELK